MSGWLMVRLMEEKGGEVWSISDLRNASERKELSLWSNWSLVSEEVALSSGGGLILAGEQLVLNPLIMETGDSGTSCDSSEGAAGEVTLAESAGWLLCCLRGVRVPGRSISSIDSTDSPLREQRKGSSHFRYICLRDFIPAVPLDW